MRLRDFLPLTPASPSGRPQRFALALAAIALTGATAALAQERGGRAVGLPTTLNDNAGSVWTVYPNGMVQQQGGNMPMFGSVGQMSVNGNANNRMNPGGGVSGKIDDRTGEVTISGLNIGGIAVTRRILIDKEAGALRFVDSFKTSGAGEQVVNVQYSSNFNFGIQSARTIAAADAKKKGQPLGWAGLTGNNRAVYSGWGLTGGKAPPRITYPEGSNVLQVAYALSVPAGKEVSVVHFHGSSESLDKAVDEISAAKLNKFAAALSGEVRRTVVNLPSRGGPLPDDLEVLRGDLTDVVETANGDQLRGTLVEKSFALKTAYGRVEVPADRLVGLVTVGRQRPLQLLVTSEGEIFGGTLEAETVGLQLASGQMLKVPLSQLKRAGYRRRDAEAEEGQTLGKPTVSLRSGERIAIAPPSAPLEFATRYGPLQIPAERVSAVMLRAEDSPAHVVTLTDGSKFSAILTVAKFDFTLDGAAGNGTLSVPSAAIAVLRPSKPKGEDEAPAESAELRTVGEDAFNGTIVGSLGLDTAFERVELAGEGIRSIRRLDAGSAGAGSGGGEIRVTMWDGTTLTGSLRELSLPVKLVSGVELSVPVDLLVSFENARPRPSTSMAESVKALVAKLNDEDFKARESAQKSLIAAGSVIAPLLRELRDAQPPEGQQRIDQILSQLEK